MSSSIPGGLASTLPQKAQTTFQVHVHTPLGTSPPLPKERSDGSKVPSGPLPEAPPPCETVPASRHQPPDFKDAPSAMPLSSLSSHSALCSGLALITHSELSPNGLWTSPTCLSVTSLFSLSSFLDQLFTLHHTSSSSRVFPSSPLTGHGVCIQSTSSHLLIHQELPRVKPLPPSGPLGIPWLAWTPLSPLKKAIKHCLPLTQIFGQVWTLHG